LNPYGSIALQETDKGKPGENRGRKAMGLRLHVRSQQDCQATEIHKDDLCIFGLAYSARSFLSVPRHYCKLGGTHHYPPTIIRLCP